MHYKIKYRLLGSSPVYGRAWRVFSASWLDPPHPVPTTSVIDPSIHANACWMNEYEERGNLLDSIYEEATAGSVRSSDAMEEMFFGKSGRRDIITHPPNSAARRKCVDKTTLAGECFICLQSWEVGQEIAQLWCECRSWTHDARLFQSVSRQVVA